MWSVLDNHIGLSSVKNRLLLCCRVLNKVQFIRPANCVSRRSIYNYLQEQVTAVSLHQGRIWVNNQRRPEIAVGNATQFRSNYMSMAAAEKN